MFFILLFGTIILFLLVCLVLKLKEKIWDNPKSQISQLKMEIRQTEDKHAHEIEVLEKLLSVTVLTPENLDDYIAEKLSNPLDCKNKNITNSFEFLLNNLDKNFFRENHILRTRVELFESAQSNYSAIPYMAHIMADYQTCDLERMADSLNWGNDQRRLKKVADIRLIRKEAKTAIEQAKQSDYQLAYLIELYPALQNIIDCEYNQLPPIKIEDFSEYDAVLDYLSKEEYYKLNSSDRNQLALDRYMNSHKKSKWQIGRDYELYIGYLYRQKGYNVDNFGSYMGIEDLGRDIIASNDERTIIIQCKYWSQKKEIHEKHITQLYGTMISYCFENNKDKDFVKGVLVTNIQLSEKAKEMAAYLGIQYKENLAMGAYPCIKCNIGRDSDGFATKIYHLPFNQQYDVTKIDKPGEFYALTVKEAERAGFRRAFRWFG